MGRRLLPFVLFAPLAGACGAGQDPAVEAVPTSSRPAAETRYDVTLDGEGEGTAELRVVPERGEVCYSIDVDVPGDPTSAHIHEGAEGEDGAVVLDLSAAGPAPWDDCSAADEVLVGRLTASPERYYVSVHTAEHPAGAVRGQLA